MSFLKRRLNKLKGAIVCVFEIYCNSGLFAMEFHRLDHLWEDLEKLGSSILFLDAAHKQHFTFVLNERAV